jgi:hypothetical protein
MRLILASFSNYFKHAWVWNGYGSHGWTLNSHQHFSMLYAWKASDCSMVRVQISFTLGVATNGLILILTIVEPHWIFLKGILRIESELQLCPSPAIKVIELEVNYFTFQWLRDHCNHICKKQGMRCAHLYLSMYGPNSYPESPPHYSRSRQ